jgi:phage repressor protein C with HTH and peptisase S24 domain
MSDGTEKPKTPLQVAVKRAIDQSGKARDYFDSKIRDRTGKSGKPIYDIERGKSLKPGLETLQLIADAFDLPLSFFTGGQKLKTAKEPDQPPVRVIDAGEVVDMISVDLSLSMGPGSIPEDFPEEEVIKFDLPLLRRITRTPSQQLRLIKGIGESMNPTLQTGDQIMVDLNERQYSRIDGIYWINHFGAHGIKRLRATGKGRMLIVSDNPAVENQEVDAEDLLIHGRAIWIAREL